MKKYKVIEREASDEYVKIFVGTEEEIIKFTNENSSDAFDTVGTFEKAKEILEIMKYDVKEIIKDVKTELGKCPICDSKNIEIENADWDGEHFWYECHCNNCDKYFTQQFKLVYEDSRED